MNGSGNHISYMVHQTVIAQRHYINRFSGLFLNHTDTFPDCSGDFHCLGNILIHNGSMNMEGNISDLMFIDPDSQFFFQKVTDTSRNLIFFIKHNTDVICQWITDLFTVLYTADSEIKMVCHGKKNGTVNLSKFLFCLIQHLIGKLQTQWRNRLDNFLCLSTVCQLLQGIYPSISGYRNCLSHFFAKSNSLSHNQTFLIIFTLNSHKGIMI